MLISAFIELLIIATIIYKERYEFVSLQEIGMLNKETISKNKANETAHNEQKSSEKSTINDLTTAANNGKKAIISEQKKPNEIGFHASKNKTSVVVNNDPNEQVVNNELQTQVVINELQAQVVINDLAAHHKNCLCCGNVFEVKNKIHKFCSNDCRYEYNENLKGYKVAQIIAKRK